MAKYDWNWWFGPNSLFGKLFGKKSVPAPIPTPVPVPVPVPVPAPVPVPPAPSKMQRLKVQGRFFVLEDGTPFTSIQCSHFSLVPRLCRGEDVRPAIQQIKSIGFNMVRTWTRMKLKQYGIDDCTLAQYPNLYEKIGELADICAEEGIRIEFTAYIGSSVPNDDYDSDHWRRLGESVKDKTNVILELMNENDIHPIDVMSFNSIRGVLCSRGSNGSQSPPPGMVFHQDNDTWTPDRVMDYCDYHTNGAPDEQNKVGKDAMKWWDGPTITNETSRYSEVGMWVGKSLDEQKQLAFAAAKDGATFCAGSCFHSVSGKKSSLFNADEVTVATSWVAGAKSVDITHRKPTDRPPATGAFGLGAGWNGPMTPSSNAVMNAILKGFTTADEALAHIQAQGIPTGVCPAGTPWPPGDIVMWYAKGSGLNGKFQRVTPDGPYTKGWEIPWDRDSWVSGPAPLSTIPISADGKHPTAWRFSAN